MARILVAEDDADLRRLLCTLLAEEGFGAIPAADGAQALLLAVREGPDLILLDVTMPHADGWEVLTQLRRFSQVPVLMLTARGQAADRIRGFQLGADDYLVKPFHPPELLLRVRSLLRRAPPQALAPAGQALARPGQPVPLALAGQPSRLEYPGLVIDLRSGLVNGQPIPSREFALLTLLASEPGRVFPRAELGRRLWGREAGFDPRTLHTHVKRLRERLEVGEFTYLHTVWGVGYRFAAERRKV